MNSRRLMGIPCKPGSHTLPRRRKAVLCITAFWPTRLPQRVIRDRVEPVASPTMSAIPPKAEDARRAIFASLAQETKLLARDHKNTFRFFVSISRDPWWGPSGPMAADRRRPRLSLAGVILFCPFARKNIVMVD